jgi:hypothetical protein
MNSIFLLAAYKVPAFCLQNRLNLPRFAEKNQKGQKPQNGLGPLFSLVGRQGLEPRTS